MSLVINPGSQNALLSILPILNLHLRGIGSAQAKTALHACCKTRMASNHALSAPWFTQALGLQVQASDGSLKEDGLHKSWWTILASVASVALCRGMEGHPSSNMIICPPLQVVLASVHLLYLRNIASCYGWWCVHVLM